MRACLLIGAWVLLTLAIGGLVDLVTGAVGVEAKMLSARSNNLNYVALIVAAFLMSRQTLTPAQLGVIIPRRWWVSALVALAVGLGFGGLAITLPVVLGATSTDQLHLEVRSVLGAVLKAILMGGMITLLYFGFVLGVLQNRVSKWLAIHASALLLAALHQVKSPLLGFDPELIRVSVGLGLVGYLVAAIRVRTGNLVLPAAGFSGFWMALELADDLHFGQVVNNAQLAYWLAPNAQPLAAPAFQLTTGVIAAVMLIWEWRRPSPPPADQATAGIDRDFKRLYPLSHTGVLAPIEIWIYQLFHVRGRIDLAYLPRVLATIAISALNSLIVIPERLIINPIARLKKVPDPLFVVGFNRSGTTHLHNLLALDPQYAVPRNYQTMNPKGFHVMGWFMSCIIAAFMPWTRPMDRVKLTLLSPQEDEFFIMHSSPCSAYWGMTFPEHWAEYDRWMVADRLTPAEQERWKTIYLRLLQKFCLFTRKRPCLKNPCNTGRARLLLELFPQARMIHIHRNPCDVYRSNQHLAEHGHVIWQFQDQPDSDGYMDRFFENYLESEQAFIADTQDIPSNQVIDIAYEDLDRDPIAVMRSIYQQLGLTWTQAYEKKLISYLARVADYKKNKFVQLDPDTLEAVQTHLQPLLDRWETNAGEKYI